MLLHYKLVLILFFWNYVHTWPDGTHIKSKYSDPNIRDWGDYSDLPTGLELGLGLEEDKHHEKTKAEPTTTLAPELDFLGDFAGKKRLWVITASSHNNNYLRMMEKQLKDMEQEGLNCRLAERDTYIITIIQNAMMEGRILKTTMEGKASVESLDPDTVSKLLHYLELTGHDEFVMLVMKKNLRTSERFPYPVRIEAIFEIIDQFPKRKLEKMTRKGLNMRCKITKKKVVTKRKKIKSKMVLSSQRRGNVTSVIAPQRKKVVDKKEALKSKIQDILNGRSRFVIRKEISPASMQKQKNGEEKGSGTERQTDNLLLLTSNNQEERTQKTATQTHKEDKGTLLEPNINGESNENPSSKKKGKGKKGKKKGRGRKSSREVSEKDRAALKNFVDSLKGTWRLLLVSTPSQDAKLYTQLKEETDKHQCDLAIRKIIMATIVGRGSDATLTLEKYQSETDSPLSGTEHISDAGLISLLRSELGLSSPDLFSMTVTDYEIKPSRVFEAPPSTPDLLEFIDNFSSRLPEKEIEKKIVPVCAKNQEQPAADNSLLRFMSKRRLLLISGPSEEDYSFQQQLSALRGQQCPLGIRHFAMLKLTGVRDKSTGMVELFPLNGRSQSEVEPLSRDTVNNLREQLKISKDYFSMLVVGKDGDVKAWFTSPLWSLDSVYDLVDAMEERAQEELLQRRLGIQCSDDKDQDREGRHYGYDVEGTD